MLAVFTSIANATLCSNIYTHLYLKIVFEFLMYNKSLTDSYRTRRGRLFSVISALREALPRHNGPWWTSVVPFQCVPVNRDLLPRNCGLPVVQVRVSNEIETRQCVCGESGNCGYWELFVIASIKEVVPKPAGAVTRCSSLNSLSVRS